ncbi:MAG TPA: alpha/beta hydrolase [Ktedonobacteraceae bacterium]|nr:alpha/beta hydrolase [Ktedonobacteraceae bacterium]
MTRRTPVLSLVFVTCCISILSFVFLQFAGFHQTSQARAASLYSIQFIPNVNYGDGTIAEEVLDECLPVNTHSLEPGVIMIHGGGWVGGQKEKYDMMCKHYASEGYIAVTIDYRLANPNLSQDTDHWPDQIGDVQLAVRFLRANASSLGLDPGRICSLGDSAGAHLALMLDELQTIHPSDVAGEYPNESPTVECVVDQFGPTDLRELYFQNRKNQEVQNDIPALLGRKPYPLKKPDPLANDASPIDNIAPQTGPALIIQGTLDKTVLPDQSKQLYQALLSDQRSPQYISYDGGHEYSGLKPSQLQAIMTQINDYLNARLQPEN